MGSRRAEPQLAISMWHEVEIGLSSIASKSGGTFAQPPETRRFECRHSDTEHRIMRLHELNIGLWVSSGVSGT